MSATNVNAEKRQLAKTGDKQRQMANASDKWKGSIMTDKKKKSDKRDDRDDQDFYVNVVKDAIATKRSRRNRWRGNKWESANHDATSSYFC